MCTSGQCMGYMGQWVQFRTPWGTHRGIVTDVNGRGVLMRVPSQYAPVSLAGSSKMNGSDQERLDLALCAYGYAGYPGAYGGYPGPYGGGKGRWGYPGAGGWYGGWWLWWLAFA